MKRCAEDAAIVLLTTNLDAVNNGILQCLERVLKTERQSRNLKARRTTNADAPSPNPSVVTRQSDLPRGSLGTFLFYLLDSVPGIRDFLTSEKATQVCVSVDRRISILHRHSGKRLTEMSANEREKLGNFLAVRSLALSHEKYLGGKIAITTFAKSLPGVTCEDEKLVVQGVVRGRAWRRLEKEVEVVGISAVACFESTRFIKGVPMDEITACAEFLRTPAFKPILDLAKEVTDSLHSWQRKFDESVVATQSIASETSTPLNQQEAEHSVTANCEAPSKSFISSQAQANAMQVTF